MNQTTINVTINPTIPTYSLMLTDQIISGFILFTYIIFGLIGNIFNILLFTRPVLFRLSSTLYLLSSSIANLFVIILVIPFRITVDAFNQDIKNYSLLSCKLVSYIYYVCLALPAFFTVLACADRWAASCVQANRRRFAKTHIAKRLIPLSIILCCLLYSHIFVTFTHDPNQAYRLGGRCRGLSPGKFRTLSVKLFPLYFCVFLLKRNFSCLTTSSNKI
jgi:hypothetical protein